MTFKYSDGGRKDAGFLSKTDCGIRAIAIATGLGYLEARKLLSHHSRIGKKGNGSIASGIYKEDLNAALESIGWSWRPAPKFDGRKAKYSDIPGCAVLRMAKHFSVVVDGILFDTWDSSHKMVYGYWSKS